MTRQPKATDTRALEMFLDPEFQNRRVWQPEELGAMLEYQWRSPLEADLSGMDTKTAHMLKNMCDAQSLCLKSYGDIFDHRMPPVEVLTIIKEYAKRNMACPDVELPGDIAKLLYILSVVVARMRCGKRITTQDDSTIRQSITALLTQPWLSPSVSELLREALSVFGDPLGTHEDGDEREAQ